MTLSGGLDRLRHHARRPLSRTPYVWDLAMWVRPGKRATLARRGTALVIDGFLRSGNTYSVAAFEVANGRELHLGRHLHGAPHLLRAARLHVPAIALIRRPADAVSSYLIRRPTLSPEDALVEYLDFYETAWRARESFVVGPFDRVVTDFGAVVALVNARFGTDFVPFRPTPDAVAAAMARVEELNRLECAGEVVETHVGRPSADRDRSKAAIAAQLESPGTGRLRRLLARADRVHTSYLELAQAQARNWGRSQPADPE